MAVSKGMDLAEMRAFVRNALDTDSDDLPDDLLDRFLHLGGDKVEAFSDSWTFRQIDYSFDSVVNTTNYKLRDPDRNVSFDADIARIEDVRTDTYSIQGRPHQELRALYRSDSTQSGPAQRYSVWGDSIYLWPTPSEAETISITGYRQPIDWIGTGADPDFPDEFHELIAWCAVSLAYAREGDPGMASYYADQFEADLRRRAASWLSDATDTPFKMNGEGAYGKPLGRLRFDWE